MRKVFILLLVLLFALVIWADNYKILQINTPNVKIGSRICSKGDTFSDESVIFWTQDKQAFRAQNLRTKEIKLFVEPEFRAMGCKTVKDYYVKTNRLSSRGGSVSISDLMDEMQDTIYLCDSIIIETPMQLDSTHFFYIVYDVDSTQIQQRLNSKENSLVFDKNLFGDGLKRKNIRFNLLYHMPEEDYPLKDSLTLVFIPWK